MHHLASALVPGTAAAIVIIKRDKGHSLQPAYDLMDDPGQASIWHMVHAFAKPCSASQICPRDGKVGSAYVDTLVSEDDLGHATALLSYAWGYQVVEVSAALSAWTVRAERDPKRTRIWICSLCLNQFRIDDPDNQDSDLQKEFGERVVAIGRILP